MVARGSRNRCRPAGQAEMARRRAGECGKGSGGWTRWLTAASRLAPFPSVTPLLLLAAVVRQWLGKWGVGSRAHCCQQTGSADTLPCPADTLPCRTVRKLTW